MNKLLIAHRGYSEIAPENTRLAFDAALLFGFDGLEIDVHQTKDNQLVVIHDETVDRTSDGKGQIKDLTLSELKQLNFAHLYPEMLKQTIMTYEEFLNEYHNKFKLLNIEIKTDQIQYEGIEERIIAIHKKVSPKCKIVYSSFSYQTMLNMHKLDPEKAYETGYLFVDEKDLIGKEREVSEICSYIHPWFKTLNNKSSMDVYKKIGLKANPWSYDKNNTGDEWTHDSHKYYNNHKNMDITYALISNSKF